MMLGIEVSMDQKNWHLYEGYYSYSPRNYMPIVYKNGQDFLANYTEIDRKIVNSWNFSRLVEVKEISKFSTVQVL